MEIVMALNEKLKKELPSSEDAQSTKNAKRLLRALDKCQMTLEILRETLVGKTVQNWKHHSALGPGVKELLKRWKKDAKEGAVTRPIPSNSSSRTTVRKATVDSIWPQNQKQNTKATASSREEKFHFFWQTKSPFAQWHASKYELGGFTYCSAEQGMMHRKALLFNDQTIAATILGTNKARTIKALGRKVKGFDPKVWNQQKEQIVYDNSVAKFTQNPNLLDALMCAEGRLVEAAPNDAIWGIGITEAQAKKMPPEKWPGSNLLGKILTRVRDDIKAGEHNELLPPN